MKTEENYSEEEMKEFLEEFLIKYRKLQENGYIPVSNLTDFSNPCQIYVIWFTPYDQQYFIVLHDDEIEDKSIFIKKVNYKTDLYDLESWINDGIIEKKYQDVFLLKVKDIIKQQSNRIFHFWIKNDITDVPIIKHDNGFSGAWFHNGFELLGLGIHDLDMDSWLKNTIFKEAKVSRTIKEPVRKEPKEKKIIGNTVFSVYFYPTIWFGDNPFNKLSEYFKGFNFTAFDNIIEISTTFRNKPLYISKNGLLSKVSDKKHEELHNVDKTEAITLFNELMSLFFVYDDEPTTIVHDLEVNIDRMSPDNSKIIRHGKIVSGQRSWILQYGWTLKPEYFHGYNPIQLKSADEFKERIKTLEQIDRKFCKLSIILLEAYDHYRNKDYIASYLLSWIVIENLLNDKWTSYIDTNFSSGKIPSKKRQEMTNSPNWTTSHVIRSLQIEKLIDTSLTNLLDLKIKALRNILVHKILKQPVDEQLVSEEKAILILHIAKRKLKLSMDKKDWISFSTNEIKLFNEIKNNWDKDDVLLKLIQSNKLFI